MSDISNICPTAWMRGVVIGAPGEPLEHDVDLSYGEDRPDGNGWIPLYRLPETLAASEARDVGVSDAEIIAVLKTIDGWAMEHGLCDSTFPKAVAAVRKLFATHTSDRQQTCEAIDGAMAFGYQNTNSPPEGHWLAPYWAIGRKQCDLEDEVLLAPSEPAAIFVLRALVAAGHVTQEKVDEAFAIAAATPGVEPAPVAVGALKIALDALWVYQSNWDTGMLAQYAQSERIAMECACEAVRDELNHALASQPAPETQPTALSDADLLEIHAGWQDSEDGTLALLRAVRNQAIASQAAPDAQKPVESCDCPPGKCYDNIGWQCRDKRAPDAAKGGSE